MAAPSPADLGTTPVHGPAISHRALRTRSRDSGSQRDDQRLQRPPAPPPASADAPASRIVNMTSSWLMMHKWVRVAQQPPPSAWLILQRFVWWASTRSSATWRCGTANSNAPATMYLWERSRPALPSLTRVAFAGSATSSCTCPSAAPKHLRAAAPRAGTCAVQVGGDGLAAIQRGLASVGARHGSVVLVNRVARWKGTAPVGCPRSRPSCRRAQHDLAVARRREYAAYATHRASSRTTKPK